MKFINGDKESKITELNVQYGHDGIYYLRDMKYIIRVIRKIASELSKKKGDIDWLQLYMESFLLLNSRFYEDLIIDFVRNLSEYSEVPDSFSLDVILAKHEEKLSYRYHEKRQDNRNRAAHGSNYQRIGIPEFDNDILPMPIRYEQTMDLANMAKRMDIIKMWQKDMLESANNIEAILQNVVSELNSI